jgi:AcrR family transcriptional regulator
MNQPARKPTRDERRDAILAVASRMFQEEGYAEVSMSNIAARLGGSKGTLYNYFRSKEELFEAHIQDRCGQFAEVAFDRLEEDEPLPVALTALGERYLTYICSEESVRTLQLIMAESRRWPELAMMFYEFGPATGLKRLTDYLERARSRGEFNAADCADAAHAFLSLCRGHTHFLRMLNLEPSPSPDKVKAEIDKAVDLFLAACSADTRAQP